jgi:hypothetical protein
LSEPTFVSIHPAGFLLFPYDWKSSMNVTVLCCACAVAPRKQISAAAKTLRQRAKAMLTLESKRIVLSVCIRISRAF